MPTPLRLADLSEIVDVPVNPPAEWFTPPDDLAPNTGLTVTDDGRVYGRWYNAGQCIVGYENACPVPSPTRCAAFHQSTIAVDEGDGKLHDLTVGIIGQSGGHARENATVSAAARHYSDPDRQRIVARIGEDEHGGWFAGALVPGLTRQQVEQVRRSSTSGDWRKFPQAWWDAHGVTPEEVRAAEGFDTLGPTLVNRPALPLIGGLARAAAVDTEGLEGALAFFSAPVPPPTDVFTYDSPDDERTAAVPDEDLTATLTLDTKAVEDLLVGHAQKIEAMVASVNERLDAIETRNRAADDQHQADVRARVAAVELPDLPAPDGFHERTWIEYTITDLEWMENTGRIAAPPPSPKSAPDRGSDQRKKDAASGVAMADGSYPIRNAGDLANAKQAVGRAPAGKRNAVIAHINKRAKALGLEGVGAPSSKAA